MSSGHDHHDNPSTDPKEVSFRTPLILALVTVLLIVLAVSTCNPKKHCCEDGAKCEQEVGHNGHEAQEEAHGEAAAQPSANAATAVAGDSSATHHAAESTEAHH